VKLVANTHPDNSKEKLYGTLLNDGAICWRLGGYENCAIQFCDEENMNTTLTLTTW
jgi:hypothetical protein